MDRDERELSIQLEYARKSTETFQRLLVFLTLGVLVLAYIDTNVNGLSDFLLAVILYQRILLYLSTILCIVFSVTEVFYLSSLEYDLEQLRIRNRINH